MIAVSLALMELGFTYPWSLVVGFWLLGEPRPLLSGWSTLLLVGGAQLLAASLGRTRLGTTGEASPLLARSEHGSVYAPPYGSHGVADRAAREPRGAWPPAGASGRGVAGALRGLLQRPLAALVQAIVIAAGFALALAASWLEHGPPTVDLTPTTLALALGVHLWRRGLLHAQGPAGRDQVERSLAGGTLALAACFLLSAVDGARSLAVLQAAAPHVVGFYGVGLTALAVARLREVRRQAGADAAGEGARGWLGLVGATVLGLLLVAVLAGQLLSFDLATAVLRPIAWALSTVLFVTFLIFGLPLMVALEVLWGWLRQYLSALPPLTLEGAGPGTLDELRRRGPGQPPPEELYLIAQWLAVGLVVALAAFLIARALLWRASSGRDDGVPEERDSVWSWALVLDGARAWLAALRRRFARRPAPPASGAGAADAAESPAATTLRQLYRDVLAAAAERGAPRPTGATPFEQLPRLQSALGPDEALGDVTRAYVRLRYGAHQPADAELDALRRWWARLRRALAAK